MRGRILKLVMILLVAVPAASVVEAQSGPGHDSWGWVVGPPGWAQGQPGPGTIVETIEAVIAKMAPWSNAHAGWTPPAPWAPGPKLVVLLFVEGSKSILNRSWGRLEGPPGWTQVNPGKGPGY